MIYHVPDDPEMGYFGDDEVQPLHRGTDQMAVMSEEDGVCFAVEEADCSICGGTIPDDATVPLCAGCVSTCKAHARQIQHQREWVADGSPR